ncbi:crotonase/enoyl-CoA hydratase family protein [Actinomadura madurae]|uniref:crotonase/enoyl-CoA hydratase family protein n=1 Tax=Actinomadura madurae TaxID=1993 RepID=UPI0020D20074|nr:crotonase/enoyl-CoA hydratase family protein [Actinomadura madurae]MCP9948293.1 crotonase/enoyl-CoA hydratase family protein [Actinomadura madurae]MCP9965067.1 crotonase/enoyl-CoA hydratase family protein [Actinomadura madurae]MCP9977557.1 crotonase/enoyl-CoA hydratase family protein [Actinomadura madurae]MCQ0010943.1 crotonase/enoyl-CoA hydratase family protein [Actinomadura madurae]MCQ0013740.1 crotonase/enoyl-CoA hydratase family protein [Actinomadura madurae]
MKAPLTLERDGHTEIWTLDLPDQRNPITGDHMVSCLASAVADVNADTDVRCVILTGAGKAFSSGGNIKDIREGRGYFGAEPFHSAEGYRAGIQRVPRALHSCEVPVIAAVNGPAVGAGCDLALMCDLRIASTRATFAESFVKLGLIPGDGGAWLLPRVVGNARAMEMTFTGEPVDAATALAWGLVSQVVEPEDLLDAARALAARITVNPPLALRMAKRLIREGQHRRLDDVLELSAALQAIAHHTRDHKEAIAAAAERRPAVFTAE